MIVNNSTKIHLIASKSDTPSGLFKIAQKVAKDLELVTDCSTFVGTELAEAGESDSSELKIIFGIYG